VHIFNFTKKFFSSNTSDYNKILIFPILTLLTGEHKLREKSLKELEDNFHLLQSKLEELNKDAVRNRKYDFSMMNQNWLNQALKSDIKLKEKKNLLLTQIGYLRINIFTEYFERVNLLRDKKQLNEAVELMNKHAEIARMFIPTKKQSAFIKRLKELLSMRSTEPIEYLQKWRASYDAWYKQGADQKPIDDKGRMEEFDQMKMAFLELYTFSFSVDNFPPLRDRRSDH
jgi:hypothetical protein